MFEIGGCEEITGSIFLM